MSQPNSSQNQNQKNLQNKMKPYTKTKGNAKGDKTKNEHGTYPNPMELIEQVKHFKSLVEET